MRRIAVPAVALALVAAGCQKDLELPPVATIGPLGVLPSFQSVAPQQGAAFVPAGGVGPYTFAFAQGGQLSGPGASIDPSGVYTAGVTGSAQDVIEVTDSRGMTATATVSVGQRIAISPAFTGTVPGGRISFQATGGGGSYFFTPGLAGSGAAAGVTSLGLYTAGATGDAVDTVVVSDQFGAEAKAEVRVGPALKLYRTETRPVAPREAVTVISIGGQPPYTYAIGPSPGSGNAYMVSPASGIYVAGDRSTDANPDALTNDVVTVTDSATVPQTATLTIPVGPRLRLVLDASDVFPGQAAHLLASGGKPPYSFGFAARTVAGDPQRASGGNGGNRSHGSVNAFTGEYVPGFSPGAVDYFQLTDATSAPPALIAGPRVGSVPLAVGSGVRGCSVGDLNGDGSQDVVLTMSGDNTSKVVTGMMLDTTEPWIQSYFLAAGGAPAYVDDFSGSGRQSLALIGGDRNCKNDGTFCPAPDVWALSPDLAGYLAQSAVAGGGPQQYVNAWNDPTYQNGQGTMFHQVTTNWGIRDGAARYDAPSSTWQFWGPGMDADTVQTTVWSPGPQRCFDPTMSYTADAWIMRTDWKVGDPQPARPACVKAKGFCPTCAGNGSYHGPVAMAIGDFDGDGRLDLAYILDTDGNRLATGASGAQLYVSYGSGGGNFGPPVKGWPPGYDFEIADRGTFQSRFQVVRPPGATADAILVRLVDANRRGRLFLVRNPAAAWASSLDPNPGGAGVDGFVATGAVAGTPTSTTSTGTNFYSWSGDDGVVTAFSLGAGLSFGVAAEVASMPFGVNTVCLPDVNADGVPDLLVVSDLGATAQLVLGDGANSSAPYGAFGQLVHQRGVAFPVVTGDFDGDGFMDAVVGNGSGSGVSVLWGGGGMLAWGGQISSASLSAAASGDYVGDGGAIPSVLYVEKSGRFGVLRSRGDGTFDPAILLTGSSAAGGPAEGTFFIWPADLNTSAPGIDAITFGQKGNGMLPRALLVQRNQGRVVDVAAKPLPPMDGVRNRASDCWGLPVALNAQLPVGKTAVTVACSYESSNGGSQGFAVWGATISNVDNGPAADATAPTWSDWVLVTSTTVSPDPAYTAPVPGGGRLRASMVGRLDARAAGMTGQREGAPVFLFASDLLYAVEVDHRGFPLDPSRWRANKYVVAPTGAQTAGFYPFLGQMGRLDADPTVAFHAVVAGGGASGGTQGSGTGVVRRTAAGYELVQRLGAGGFPIGIGPLTAGSAGDALLFVGDWANAGLVPELVPHLNDGSGKLR